VDALSQLTRYEERNSADPHLDKAERWIDKGNRHRAQWRGLLSDCVRRLNTAERRHEQIFTRVPLKMTCVALLRRRLKYRKE
jgi:hypothetical protein